MKYDISQYERKNEGDPKKTYTHLKNCVQLVIRMQEQKKNSMEREALLTAKPVKIGDVSGAAAVATTNQDKRVKEW